MSKQFIHEVSLSLMGLERELEAQPDTINSLISFTNLPASCYMTDYLRPYFSKWMKASKGFLGGGGGILAG